MSFVITGVSFSRFSDHNQYGHVSTTRTRAGVPGISFTALRFGLRGNHGFHGGMVGYLGRNKDSSGTVSGYSQNVTLEVKTTANLPLHFKLERNSPCQPQSTGPLPVCRRNTIGQEWKKQSPTLTISWPKESNHLMYRNELDYIELRLKAVQA